MSSRACPRCSAAGRRRSISTATEALEWAPSVDISETDTEFLVRAELPAVKKEDVHITVDDRTLTISGERRQTTEDKKEKMHRVETVYGKFSRSFTLPDNTDTASIRAESKDGVITLHIAKDQGRAEEADRDQGPVADRRGKPARATARAGPPRSPHVKTIRRILFAVRNPDAPRQPGINKAIQIASSLGASLELFHALTSPVFLQLQPMTGESIETLRARPWRHVRNRLGEFRRPGTQAGRALEYSVEWDYPPHEAIVRRAGKIGRRPHRRRMPPGYAHACLADSSHRLGAAAHQPTARVAAQERQAVSPAR